MTPGLDLSGPVTTCASVGGCQFTADGTVQILGTITWLPTIQFGQPVTFAPDTIEFQAIAPEPGSVALIALGLRCLVALKRRYQR